MIDHISIQVADVEASAEFYDAVLGILGHRRMLQFERPEGLVIGYGTESPDFWLGPVTQDGAGREAHLAFTAQDRATVDRFHEVATGRGAEELHAPRVWPEYHEHYYGAFVRDPDGNNVEAVCQRAL